MPASSVALCRTVARVLRTSETSRERKGGLQPLDVGGVDHRRGTALRGLRGSEPLSHLSLRAANDAPKDPNHPSAGVPLNRLGDHDPLRQKKSRPSSLAGANRLTQYLERLLRAAGEPVGVEQQALGCSTSAHTKKERPDQMPVAPHLHHAAKPQPATNRKRQCQPHHAADDANAAQLIGLTLPQEPSPGLNDLFVNPPALPPALALPARDGTLVQRKGRDYGLWRAAVCQKRHDGYDQLVRLVRPVESWALGGGEGSAASFAAIAALFSAVDHDRSLARSSVGPQ